MEEDASPRADHVPENWGATRSLISRWPRSGSSLVPAVALTGTVSSNRKESHDPMRPFETRGVVAVAPPSPYGLLSDLRYGVTACDPMTRAAIER